MEIETPDDASAARATSPDPTSAASAALADLSAAAVAQSPLLGSNQKKVSEGGDRGEGSGAEDMDSADRSAAYGVGCGRSIRNGNSETNPTVGSETLDQSCLGFTTEGGRTKTTAATRTRSD